jgi:hypothetical protein
MSDKTPLWSEAEPSYQMLWEALRIPGKIMSPTDYTRFIEGAPFEVSADFRPRREGNPDFFLHPERITGTKKGVIVLTNVSCIVLAALGVQKGQFWVPNGLEIWREQMPTTKDPNDSEIVYGYAPALDPGNSSYRMELMRVHDASSKPVVFTAHQGRVARDVTFGTVREGGSMEAVESVLKWAVSQVQN